MKNYYKISSIIFLTVLFFVLQTKSNTAFALHSLATATNKNTPQLTESNKQITDKNKGLLSFLKNKSLSVFPVPIVESRPDEGESYGLMPVLLFTDKDTQAISTILAALGQYNSITKGSGAFIVYHYPHPVENPDELFEFYVEISQKYYRETTAHYLNPKFLKHYFLETSFSWLKSPFPRFYGYGANTTKAGQSNYVGRNFVFDTTFGYYLTNHFRINVSELYSTTDLLSRAFPNVADTLTLYGAQAGVHDASTLVHALSLTYDTRPDGLNSTQGFFLQGKYFFSIKDIFSDNTFQGFNLEAIKLVPFWHERMITAIRFFFQDMYGNGIPFYLQSTLGGPNELRAFIPSRFTDNGKFILSIEQRIHVVSLKLFGNSVNLFLDPFFELGRVFDNVNNFGFNNLQPVGGLGLRSFVPPDVVGRLDLAFGKEGYAVYTMLGYAF